MHRPHIFQDQDHGKGDPGVLRMMERLWCRVHTLMLPVVTEVADLYGTADGGAAATLVSKLAIEKTFQAKLEETRNAIQVSLVVFAFSAPSSDQALAHCKCYNASVLSFGFPHRANAFDCLMYPRPALVSTAKSRTILLLLPTVIVRLFKYFARAEPNSARLCVLKSVHVPAE